MKLLKSPKAKADLEEIWLYSFEQWGEAQADLYFNALSDAMEQILNNHQVGKSHEHVRTGYRALHIKRHVIYYRVLGEIIDIVRVLHERMIPTHHL